MAIRNRRFGVTFSICAVALALAGCNAQHQGELAANVAAGAPVEPGNVPSAAQGQQAEAEIIAPKIDGVPLPPVRPDFVKLAKEREQQQGAGATQVAGAGTAPVTATGAPEGGVTTVAQAYAPTNQPRPSGIFSIFAGAPADPAAPVQVVAANENVSDAPVQGASLLAYERRVAGEDTPAAPAQAPAASTAFRLAPAAVVEVAGVTRELQPSRSAFAAPALIGPGPQIAGTFGMGGRNWRPAYDHVVTNCFGPDLRAALENIARHFNSEVLVTSGHRDNGRRRSMHRFCRAADIRVVGVSPGTVANYAANVPGVNGVGTYRRVAVTHIDTRENRMAWRH